MLYLYKLNSTQLMDMFYCLAGVFNFTHFDNNDIFAMKKNLHKKYSKSHYFIRLHTSYM